MPAHPIDLRALAASVASAVALAGAALAAPAEAWAARLALVVGNDNYQHASRLRNARNDATAVARELQAAGFQVNTVLDATREAMNEAIDAFLRRIDKGDEVVFYFSGHGTQPPSLGPTLLPVDVRIANARAVERDGLALERLADDLNQRARFTLLIIDACRDDPFRETVAGRSLPAGSGLARIEPPRGTMIIMAASKGQQALDRLSNNDPVPNGLFTRELIRHMRTPGLAASDMLKRVRNGVESAAAGVNHAQRPSLVDESSAEFYFHLPAAGAQAGAGAAAAPAPSPTVAGAAPAPAPAPAPTPAPAPAPAVVPAPAPAPVAAYAPAPATTTTPAPAAVAPPADASQLAQRHQCLACHMVDKRLVGPAFRDVARRYAGQPDAAARLGAKLQRGGSGSWGPVPMPSQSHVPERDRQALVAWVLGQGR